MVGWAEVRKDVTRDVGSKGGRGGRKGDKVDRCFRILLAPASGKILSISGFT